MPAGQLRSQPVRLPKVRLPKGLDPLKLVQGQLVLDIAGIERGSGLEEHDPALFLSYRTMFDAARHDDEFAFFDPLMAVEEIHAQAPFHDQEQFIFIVVMVKNELAVQLHELDMLSIEFSRDARRLEVGDPGKLFGDIDFGH